ncbi:MAG: 30S ribosomal protein S12 methylthiotransferase RimO, partial [Betaproteobacteria bacterium]
SYITLADVKKMVLGHEAFEVRDAKSGEDLTRSILLQIILEEESGGVPMFSAATLEQIIRFYGHAMQGVMGQMLEQNMTSFAELQKQFLAQAPGLGKGFVDPKSFTPELWTQWLSGQPGVMQSMMDSYAEQGRQMFEQLQRTGAGIKLTPRHYAYLKISEGCNHRCTFCIIPSMRGDLVSRPVGEGLTEARALFESGVKELLVISQDTSAYGVDLQYRTGFFDGRPVKTRMTELCEQLAKLAEPFGAWIRLHYVYPYPHVDELLPLMADGRILPYLDVPMQHAHPDVLKRMKRPASGEKNLERLAKWRAACPQIVVRSTFIAGFPGETETEFEYLLDFLREARIDRAGCFAYSPVNGAAANALPGLPPLEVREERRARFMAVAEAVSAQKLQQRIGATMQVLVDHAPALGRRGGVGRSYADAPEIDGTVRLLPPEKASRTLKVGEFTKARIVGTEGHDLVGVPA